jgi:fumarate hydratase class II
VPGTVPFCFAPGHLGAMAATRTETDSFGPIEVPADRLWGAQTQRSLHHFHFPGETMPLEVVHAQVLVKKAAALTNVALGVLDRRKGDAIVKAADEALRGWSCGRPAPAPRPT